MKKQTEPTCHDRTNRGHPSQELASERRRTLRLWLPAVRGVDAGEIAASNHWGLAPDAPVSINAQSEFLANIRCATWCRPALA